MTNKQIYTFLTQDYSLELASSTEEFLHVKALRKEIFSKKFNLSADTLERNGYLFNKEDRQSFIYLLKHNSSNTYVGTVRIFFINTKTPLKSLSMQRIGKVQNVDSYTKDLPLAEISRMCLKSTLPKHSQYSVLQVRTMLASALMIMTRINFFLYPPAMIFSVMERSLTRILTRQNVLFEQIADPIEFYGLTTPYAIATDKLLRDTELTMGSVTRYYLKIFCKQPNKLLNYINENPYLSDSDLQLERITQLFQKYGENVNLDLLLNNEVASSHITNTLPYK